MRYTLENFNAFRDACHTASRDAGWWKGSRRYGGPNHGQLSVTGAYNLDALTIPTKLCLVHSEISEMYEGYMSGAMDEHLPHLPNAAVEGGDTLIRIGDTAGYLEIDMNAAIMMVLQADHIEITPLGFVHWIADESDVFRRARTGPEGWFALLHYWSSGAMEGFRKNAPDKIIPSMRAMDANLARIVILVDLIARKNDWDLPAVCEAKMAYNAVRPDHKAEARNAEGGKGF